MSIRSQLLKSVTSIGMAIGMAAPITIAQANPSISTIDRQNNSIAQAAPADDATPRRYGRSIALGAKVDTVSGLSEVALAEFLATNDVKFYGAYWCSHCQQQKSLFGATAAAKLPYVECAADGDNSQRELCRTKGIKMFPTWVINGKFYPGTKDLKDIAAITNYKGSTEFKYKK